MIIARDVCVSAAEYGVSLSDFYSWNPAVGHDCSGLLYGYYVYVGVPGTTATTATTAATATAITSAGPSPTQTGITSTCELSVVPLIS